MKTTTALLTLALILSSGISEGQQIYNPTASNLETGNTAGGFWALSGTSGVYGTGFGYAALNSNTSGYGNTAIGGETLRANTSGSYNTATGTFTLGRNTTGNGNTGNGFYTLPTNSTGSYNTASGLSSLVYNTTGETNSALGAWALGANISGSSNTATGAEALASNTTGIRNTASGVSALLYNTTGFANTAHGVESLFSNTTGIRNTALGTQALISLSTGNNNLALGWASGNALTSGSNNIYLVHPGVTSEAQTMRLGNTQTRTFIAGIKGVPISGATLTINNAGQVGILASSARFKTGIAPMATRSADIYKLRPVMYHYKAEPDGQLQYGLIAEEVNAVYPEIVAKDATGQIESVQYHQLISMLVNEVQKQQKQIENLQGQIDTLQQNTGIHTIH